MSTVISETIKTPENGLPVDPEKSVLAIQLVGDRVLIDPFDPDEYLSEAEKIAKPVGFKEPHYKGKVMTIGDGEYGTLIAKSLKIGLIVLYWHQQAVDFKIDNKTYHMVRASDVFGYL